MTRALLPVELAGVWIALETEDVIEVLGEAAWVALPGARRGLPGACPWKGRAIAVLDLGALMEIGAPMRAGERRPRTVIVRHGTSHLAILVDAVREVVEELPRLAGDAIELDGRLVPIVDLAALARAVAPPGGLHEAERPDGERLRSPGRERHVG